MDMFMKKIGHQAINKFDGFYNKNSYPQAVNLSLLIPSSIG